VTYKKGKEKKRKEKYAREGQVISTRYAATPLLSICR